MNISLKIVLLSVFFCLLIVILIFQYFKGEETETRPNNRLSTEQKLEQAEEFNDVEKLQEIMPWLNIISARWKQIVLGDFLDGIPAPTDIRTTGILTLDSDYLKEIRESYQWYEDTWTIPSTFLTDEMEGYVLERSYDYELSYRPLFGSRGQLVIAIDFEKEVVFFSYVS